jgi:uncharacterized membrane protein YuzA (DUF378 family)
MRVALRLGSLGGIAILVHFSWLLIFALLAFSLVAQFAGEFPQLSQAVQLSIGLTASVLFFNSFLFHELAHSWLALRYGNAGWTMFACWLGRIVTTPIGVICIGRNVSSNR